MEAHSAIITVIRELANEWRMRIVIWLMFMAAYLVLFNTVVSVSPIFKQPVYHSVNESSDMAIGQMLDPLANPVLN